MISDRDVIRVVETWLEEEVSVIPDRVLDAVLDRVPATPQRRAGWLARRLPIMNSNTFRFGVAAVAVVLIAIVGYQLLPRGGTGGPQASPTPTVAPTATATPSPSPTPAPSGFPVGAIPAGTYHLDARDPVPFSVALASDHWTLSDARYPDFIETGEFGSPGWGWIVFMTPIDKVSRDPCAGTTTIVHSVDEAATAMTAIAGTDAAEPTDTTVGGAPAKLVEFTINGDFACDRASFWLYGDGSYYPGSTDSVIRDWVFERNGKVYFVHTDQIGTDVALADEIRQIVDSIQFD